MARNREFDHTGVDFRGLNSNLRLVSWTPNRTAQVVSREKILEYSRKRCPEGFSVVGFAQECIECGRICAILERCRRR